MNTPRQSTINQISDIDLKLLRVFKAIVESGGFSAAEISLNISRSTISTYMTTLETRIGMRLCERGRGGFSLTTQGADVYQAILTLFKALDEFQQKLAVKQSELSGTLKLSVPDGLLTESEFAFTEVLSKFKASAEKVQLHLFTNSPNEIENTVLTGGADIGITPYHQKRDSLHYQLLYQEDFYLYCAHSHPLFEQIESQVSVADIYQNAIAGPSHATLPNVTKMLLKFTDRGIANHLESRVMLLMTGHYIGFLPAQYAANWVRDGLVKAILPKTFNYVLQHAAIYRKDMALSIASQRFLKQLKGYYQ